MTVVTFVSVMRVESVNHGSHDTVCAWFLAHVFSAISSNKFYIMEHTQSV